MNTMIKGSNGITLVPAETRLLSDRKVFIEGEITASSACEFVRAVMLLVKESVDKPIDVYINSPGGEVNAGLLIYDTMKSIDIEINLHCIGMAASMAAIIFAGGKMGHRYITPHGQVMIHEPLIVGGLGGSATSIMRSAESVMEMKKLTVELLSADTHRSREEVEAAISYDNTMNAEAAVAFGICDSIEYSIV